jgi:hypothetical protein
MGVIKTTSKVDRRKKVPSKRIALKPHCFATATTAELQERRVLKP